MNGNLKYKGETLSQSRKQAPSGEPRILFGDEIPAAALDSFYEEVFPARTGLLNRSRQWLYRTYDGTSARAPVAAMLDGRVVGHLSFIPVRLRRGNEEREAAWACDLVVLPECRGRRLGQKLFNAMTPMRPLWMGFPNPLSGKVLDNLGWKSQSDTIGLSLVLRPERHPKVRKGKAYGANHAVYALAAAAGLATRAISYACARPWKRLTASPVTMKSLAPFVDEEIRGLHVRRSAEYLGWRLLDHPRAEEHVILSSPGAGPERPSAVARVVESKGYRRLHLLSLRAVATDGAGRSGLHGFFAGTLRWALDADVHMISLVTSEPAVADVARWWLPVTQKVRYSYHASDPEGMAFLGGSDHHWEYLDNDFDLIYVSDDASARGRAA